MHSVDFEPSKQQLHKKNLDNRTTASFWWRRTSNLMANFAEKTANLMANFLVVFAQWRHPLIFAARRNSSIRRNQSL